MIGYIKFLTIKQDSSNKQLWLEDFCWAILRHRLHWVSLISLNFKVAVGPFLKLSPNQLSGSGPIAKKQLAHVRGPAESNESHFPLIYPSAFWHKNYHFNNGYGCYALADPSPWLTPWDWLIQAGRRYMGAVRISTHNLNLKCNVLLYFLSRNDFLW